MHNIDRAMIIHMFFLLDKSEGMPEYYDGDERNAPTDNSATEDVVSMSFAVSVACQEALGSQNGLPLCRDVMEADMKSLAHCQLRDQLDKEALMRFPISGSRKVCVH